MEALLHHVYTLSFCLPTSQITYTFLLLTVGNVQTNV